MNAKARDAEGMVRFPVTRWTLISKLGSSPSETEEGLTHLCQSYWLPCYSFIRGRRYSPEDAEDLTQSFILKLIKRDGLAGVDATKGRFRSYMLGALKNFLANDIQRSNAQKRGGGQATISIDRTAVEDESFLEPADHESPDKHFDRVWGLTTLETVVKQLQAEFLESGKEREFEVLEPFISPQMEQPRYAEAAESLKMNEGALRGAVFRLRQKFRKRLREVILETVASPHEVEDEIEALFAAFASSDSRINL